ncbi:hypothetical protein BH20CHL2_BH20CHL2_05760 [soil metagenome]
MSDDWTPRPDSRWSSERDRARREAGEPEPTQQTESPISNPPESPPGESSFHVPESRPGGRRRVGDRASRQSRSRSDESSTQASTPSATSRSGVRTVPSAEAGSGGGTPGGRLPDLPGGQGGSGGSRNNRVLILGALLFLGMAAFAVLPRLLDDDTGAPPSPTPELIQTPTPAPDEQGTSPTPPRAVADAEHLVCIDPGHGGWDDGWVREANSRAPAILEKEINLGMGWMLKERLEDRGIGVVMTRTSGLAANVFNEDVNGDGQTIQNSDQAGHRDELQARINVCNEAGADILISLHLNGFDNTTVRGYEVLYTPAPFRDFGDRNFDLATFLYREMGAAYAEAGFETDPRSVIPDTDLDVEMHEFGSERHLIMTGPAIENADYTIEPSAMPGAVVEAVFISNDDDAAFIALPANQELVVEAYVRGIVTYFEQYPEAP